MLRRVLVPVLAASFAMALGPAVPAAARQASRVVVLTVDGTSIEDWASSGVFGSLGAGGLLATRTATETGASSRLREAAYTTLGAGASAKLEPSTPTTEAGRGVLAGALGEALKRRGLSADAIGDASGEDIEDAPADRAVMLADGSVPAGPVRTPPAEFGPTSRPDRSAPAGRRTDYRALHAELQASLEWASVVIVDLGDTARADRIFGGAPENRAPWVAQALRDAAGFADETRSMLDPGDTLIVASLVPPIARVRSGVHLGAVAMTGGRGLPLSGTTRRPGVLSLTDMGPTILERVDVPVPDEMQGRAARLAPSRDPLRDAARLDAGFVLARESRRPLTRVWLILAALLTTAAFLTTRAGRGATPAGERLPRRGRDLVATGLIASVAAPAAMLVAPALPGSSTAAIGWWTLGLSVAAALILRAVAGIHRGCAIAALVGTGIVIGDLIAGEPLASRSPLGFQVAGGGRFYGIDEGLLGVLLAGALIAAAGLVDGSTRPRRAAVAVALPLTAVAVIAAAPALGSKFGATFTLVPAFGFFVVLATGRRLDRASAIGVTIATLFIAASLAVADALTAPAARSHIGREIAGDTPVGPLIARKLSSFLEITGTTIWLPVALVIAVPLVLFLIRRPDLLARGFWGMPGRRAALAGVAVGCITAMGSNDTGIIVVAPALVVGAAAYYGPLLAPPIAWVVRRVDESREATSNSASVGG